MLGQRGAGRCARILNRMRVNYVTRRSWVVLSMIVGVNLAILILDLVYTIVRNIQALRCGRGRASTGMHCAEFADKRHGP
jgi:hypothetical protein